MNTKEVADHLSRVNLTPAVGLTEDTSRVVKKRRDSALPYTVENNVRWF